MAAAASPSPAPPPSPSFPVPPRPRTRRRSSPRRHPRVTWEIEPIRGSCRLTVAHHQLPEGQQDDNLNGGPSSLALEEQGTSPSVPAIRDPKAPTIARRNGLHGPKVNTEWMTNYAQTARFDDEISGRLPMALRAFGRLLP